MERRIKPEQFFLAFAIVVGILLVFLTPPLNGPDEQLHFVNAYSVSRGRPFGTVTEDGVFSRNIPEGDARFLDRYPGRFVGNTTEKFSYSDMIGESRNESSLGAMVHRGDPASPVGYLASAAGMITGTVIGKLFQENAVIPQPYNQMIFGRLGNLFFYIAVVYYALKIIPCMKRTMLLLAMMPMTLFQAASLSYDAELIPISFLFAALVMKLVSRKEQYIRNKDIGAVLFCVFFMVGAKQAYAAPLLLLLLAVPRKKYGSAKRMAVCVSAVIVTGIIAYLPELIHQRIAAGAVANPVVSEAVSAQKEWVGNNLLKLPGIFLNTIWDRKAFYADSFFGILGWLDTPFPIPVTLTGLLLIGITAVIETCSGSLFSGNEWWKRLLSLGGVLIAFSGLLLVMYINHTPRPDVLNTIGGNLVEGVQGRYLIPLVFPIMIACSNGLLPYIRRKNRIFAAWGKHGNIFDYTVYGWCVFSGILTVLIVLLRYWI